MHALFAIQGLILFVTNLAAAGSDANLTNVTLTEIGTPVVDCALVLIPAAIAMSSINKLMEHRETAMGLVIDVIVKGGSAVGGILVFKAVSGM